MRFMIGFDVDMPEEVADKLIRTAGEDLKEADYPLVIALAVIAPFPAQIRELLLSPGHDPVPLNVPTLLTTERSAVQVRLMLTTPGTENPQWTSNKSFVKPKPATRAKTDAGSRSGSTSKSRRKRTRTSRGN